MGTQIVVMGSQWLQRLRSQNGALHFIEVKKVILSRAATQLFPSQVVAGSDFSQGRSLYPYLFQLSWQSPSSAVHASLPHSVCHNSWASPSQLCPRRFCGAIPWLHQSLHSGVPNLCQLPSQAFSEIPNLVVSGSLQTDTLRSQVVFPPFFIFALSL